MKPKASSPEPLDADLGVPNRGFGALSADLKRLFLAWQEDLSAYAAWWMAEEPVDRDLPHWYNERTSIGFMAQALRTAFPDQVVVLEEFRQRKTTDAKRGKPTSALGRGDLWFSLRSPRSRVYIEAKQAWPNLNSTKAHHLAEPFRKAIEAAAHVSLEREKPGAVRLGAVFFCPYVNRKKWEKLSDDKGRGHAVQAWTEKTLAILKKTFHMPLAWATWFPWDLPPAEQGAYYPGILLVLGRLPDLVA